MAKQNLRRAPLRNDITNTLNGTKNTNKTKNLSQIKIDKKKVSLISQEIKIARLLANNDKKVRDKVLKRMKKWLTVRSQDPSAFTKLEFMSLWKGLFYCMWMSDKMLVQEELAESLSKLVHCFSTKNIIVLYTSCALKTLAIEWFGIDQYRIDKFFMLVRRIVRQTFVVCKNKLWDMEWVMEISLIFEELLLHPKTPVGYNLHLTDVYLEELAKVSDGNLPEDAVYEFVKPFILYLVTSNDERQIKNITQCIFRYLIFQSDVGLNYTDKFNAWRSAGFPCAKLDDMQQIEISDMEDDFDNENEQCLEIDVQNKVEKSLDPRAGRVDVELPQIPFDAAKLADLLLQHRFHPLSTAKSRKRLLKLASQFRELSQGNMPLGMKTIEKPNSHEKSTNVRNAALRFIKFEKKLFSDKITKKQKRKSNKELVNTVFNASSLDSSKNENVSDQNEDQITSETSKVNDVKVNFEDAISLKKRKRSKLKHDKLSDKPLDDEIAESTNSESWISTNNTNKNVKYKTKTVTYPQKKTKRKIKPAVKNALSRNKIARDRDIPSKNVLSSCVTKRTCSNNSLLTKKKVMFKSQNNAHYKSDYLQQIRKSPGVPFDANKKPLYSVLKTSPIPSPINPFYKNRLA
ncbi:ribosomal RNA processing protein 1 homolog isoform X1 [Pseudomyrmex gracilis]|uniref:ribosomal RNA processing protein 1 homolog isoform X1 n=1 Tax=Pseudomyrmex gracilis TaxID=219809 RepID=UPI000994CAD6|nr:ribosomal RNA processing protein 1 homolog isoform X1 [Pseudomyrmex gracilis]XP_020299465.1 ribosomal RNA processing protein 1 homolog isoform X1 [Pseudomyrmex gracilis]XP_020299466.1 ribosomal RNA processing protein 1 homolog isoform X1 [Pseudomyrmex gracilis]XP_020299467.1 ribosomal RNA processing protein 1 homolog isoform X1 [Pseudomyrmex gracilis]XP_020299468.1 ribosomal RNA processing protein 1 homolog isoform X1 [Pseudomyrmex gracilis]XP_020299470.1 ribosomal RNA processing protein 1 